VIKTSASEGTGIEDLVKNTIDIASLKERPASYPRFSGCIEDTLEMISVAANKFSGDLPKRWLSVNLFSRDPILRQLLPLEEGDMNEIEDLIKSCEESNDDDSESMIANERYTYIDGILKGTVMKRGAEGLSVSDRIDMVLTNRLLVLPIFFMIMWGIYYISIQTLGDMTIGWTETLFGTISEKVSALLSSANVAEWLHALIITVL
jgi:ferrous iron transport protein B